MALADLEERIPREVSPLTKVTSTGGVVPDLQAVRENPRTAAELHSCFQMGVFGICPSIGKHVIGYQVTVCNKL